MNDVRMAIVDRLRSDPFLAGVLGKVRGVPAVFAGPPLPEQRPEPYIAVDLALFERPGPTRSKTHDGREVAFPIKTVADPKGRLDVIDRITGAVRRALEAEPIETLEWKAIVTQVSGPAPGPEPQSVVYNREQTLFLQLAARG